MVTPFSCPHFIPRLCPAALRSTFQYKPDTRNHDTLLFWPSCKSVTSLCFKKRNVWIACFVCIFLASGWKKKYDECVLARGKWVVCICQHCYYSRQRSYRPISRTIITIISSRSPNNSSQLSIALTAQTCTSFRALHFEFLTKD